MEHQAFPSEGAGAQEKDTCDILSIAKSFGAASSTIEDAL